MADSHLLKKDHLKGFLRKLAKEYRLVAPVRNRHGDVLFSEINDLDTAKIELGEPPQNSLKQFLLPQQEQLYTYMVTPEGYDFSPTRTTIPPTVYFGVHSCDLSAVLYMDVVFSRRQRDPFYLRRRHGSVLIGINCNTPSPNCFCNATGSGPFVEMGSDLQLTDLGDRFLVETGRAPGQALVQRWQRFFSSPTDKDREARYQAFLEARGRFTRQVHVEQAIRRLTTDTVPEEVWEELSLRCQDCGGCAYLCPTCTCFTINDQQLDATSGLRLRSWDACTFRGFTAMAGGHNPVQPKTGAIRQRFQHKLRDDVRLNGRPSCVGCGRCVGACFGGTDIVRFVDRACQGIL
ncbi:MAG TPA: 4Fe-4S dicluster domain-containing protein [Deltaproteobacteria bacterium]|nr:4Fe-4S dicluster domain-containing protein [Deltaproteobacteria bacterium]